MNRDFCGGEDLAPVEVPANGNGQELICNKCHCLDNQRCPECWKCKRCGKPVPFTVQPEVPYAPAPEPWPQPYRWNEPPYFGDWPGWRDNNTITC